MSVISISALLRCHTCKVERGSIVMAFLTIKLAERKPLAMPITVRPSVELNTGSMIFPLSCRAVSGRARSSPTGKRPMGRSPLGFIRVR
jgi:hypothetical protein